MAESAAHRFHRLTSYTPARHWLVPADDPAVRRDFVPMSRALKPSADKSYPPAQPRVRLPPELPGSGVPGGAVLGGLRSVRGSAEMTLAEVSGLLHWSAGVVRKVTSRDGSPVYFRSASSAGNVHPIEVYLHACGVAGLRDGIWHYQPAGHELVWVGPAAADGTGILLTGVPWRAEWRYAERGYRHLWWDAGSVSAHAELIARAYGRTALIRLHYPDSVVAATVGADDSAELALAVIGLGRDMSCLEPRGAAAGSLGQIGPEFPLVSDVHDAGRCGDWGDRAAALSPDPVTVWAVDATAVPAEELVRRRTLSRNFRHHPVSRAALTWPAEVSARLPDWDQGDVRAAFSVFVHNVDGVEPGLYEMRDGALHQARAGDMREAARSACLGQPAAGECAYVVLMSAQLDEHLRALGPRAYRAVNFFAGMAASRMQLAVTALGLASTPLTVCDEVASRYVPAGAAALLCVAVGQSALSRHAGVPRAPSSPAARPADGGRKTGR